MITCVVCLSAAYNMISSSMRNTCRDAKKEEECHRKSTYESTCVNNECSIVAYLQSGLVMTNWYERRVHRLVAMVTGIDEI